MSDCADKALQHGVGEVARSALGSDAKVAVLVATWNGEPYIAEQLDSLLAQSYPDFEIHVFDDASTDSTPQIIEQAYLSDPRVFLHRNGRRLGFVRNFEQALQTVQADYFALCDQDDIWRPDKLQLSMEQMHKLESACPGSPVLVHSDLQPVDQYGHTLAESFFRRKQIELPARRALNRLIGHCGVMGNTIVMNRALVELALPFPPGLKYHDYWLAVVNEIFGLRQTLRQPLVKYRIHDRNTSNNRRLAGDGQRPWRPLLNRQFRLPLADDDREPALRYLLDNYAVPQETRGMIEDYCDYLAGRGSRFGRAFILLRHRLLGRNWRYRLGAVCRLLLARG